MEYFFIGEAELVTAFRFVGVGGIAVSGPKESSAAFKRVTRGWVEEAGAVIPDSTLPPPGEIRVLILSEEVADSLGSELADWQISGKYPLVVEIPGLQGRLAGRKTLVDTIRQAIGVRV